MTLFTKIKRYLQTENACVISKNKIPEFVVLKWETYQDLISSVENMSVAKKMIDEEQSDGEYDIDINKIPV